MVVLNLEVGRFVSRIPEEFLNLDFDRLGDVGEAPPAHAGVARGDVGGDQDAFVHRLEAHLCLDRFAFGDRHEPLAPLLRGAGVDLELAHLARAVQNVAHREGERTVHMLSCHPAMLAVAG